MGIHRDVISPKFGNFVLQDLLDAEVSLLRDHLTSALVYASCAFPYWNACIAPDGNFVDFTACYTHNYREIPRWFHRLGEWDRRQFGFALPLVQVHAVQTASMWQSLSFGANHKAAYCMAVFLQAKDVRSVPISPTESN